MLAPTLRRHIHHRTLQQFQQSLLHAFTTHITGNGRIITLACYFVYLINKHDTLLCLGHVIIRHLEQTRQNAFNVLTHITCLCQNRCIYNSKRNMQQLGDSTRQ